MRKKDRECEWVERCESAGRVKQREALIIHVCECGIIAAMYGKAARKAAANVELARTLQERIQRGAMHNFDHTQFVRHIAAELLYVYAG